MALTKIGTDGIKDDAITKSKIPANQIEASELADNAVDTNAIADQAVALSKLPHGTSSNDGKFLRANNGADPTFETVSIPPSVGGANGVDFNDSVKARFGTGNDLEIYHNATDSYITNATGDLLIDNNTTAGRTKILTDVEFEVFVGNTEAAIKSVRSASGGQTELYHSGTKKFETTSTGVNVQSSGSSHGITVKHSNGNVVAKMTNKGSGDEGYLQLNDAGEVATIKMDAEHGRITASSIRLHTDNAANELDDYEEGTFTATCQNSVTLHSNADLLAYTKIGRQVTVRGQIHINDSNGDSDLIINNLPFVCASTGEDSAVSVGAARTWGWDLPSDNINVICMVSTGLSQIDFWCNRDNTTALRLDADGGAYIGFTLTYFTT